MLSWLLFLILVWVVLGIIGFIIHGLFWLFLIACLLVILTLVGSAFGRGRQGGKRTR